MWSLLGSLTRFHVFLRVREGGTNEATSGWGRRRGGDLGRGEFSGRLRAAELSRVGPGAARAAKPRPRRSRVVVRRWRARARSLGDTSGRDGTRGWRGGRPRRRPAAAPPLEIHVSGKKNTEPGVSRPPRRRGAGRTIGTGTRSPWRTGSRRPSRCPAGRSRPWPRSCAARVTSSPRCAAGSEVTTGVTRLKTKGLEPRKKRDATFDEAAATDSRDQYVAFSAASARNRDWSSGTMESRNCV